MLSTQGSFQPASEMQPGMALPMSPLQSLKQNSLAGTLETVASSKAAASKRAVMVDFFIVIPPLIAP